MEPLSYQQLAVRSTRPERNDGAQRRQRASGPSVPRLVAVFVSSAAVVGGCYALAGQLASSAGGAAALPGSVVLGIVTTLLVASLVEWVVHRWIMHRPSRLPGLGLAYEHHHRAHHWINFPPDQYKQSGRVQYVPLWTARLDRAATSRIAWALTIAGHAAFYAVFGVLFVILPAWAFSGNAVFAWTVTVTALAVMFLFIHAHDAMHYPGMSPVERAPLFRWLDHHHYIHHVDTGANTNFLLPLGDLLLGTLRRTLSPEELRRWPACDDARRQRTDPVFLPDGTRLRAARRAD